MKKSRKQKMNYHFDNIMAKGTISMVLVLFFITVFVVFFSGVIAYFITGEKFSDIFSLMWQSFNHAIDSGALGGDDTSSVWFIVLMTVVTICGLLITSVLIGIVNNALENKLHDLSKGKSKVIEKNHTVILGFNEGIYTIISELVEANSNHKNCKLVIMSDLDVEEMKDNISNRIHDFKTTKIILRNGDISNFNSLDICSIETCKSVIINSNNDFQTIKSVLAISTILNNNDNKDVYITTVIQEKENIAACKIAGGDRIEILYFKDIMSKIIAHTCRQTGLSKTYTELFDYGGDEIYIENFPTLYNKSFGEANLYFPISTIIGIEKDGEVNLNPTSSTIIEEGSNLILIAEDDGVSIPLENPLLVNKDLVVEGVTTIPPKQKILVIGINPKLESVIAEEDNYMVDGSEIKIAVLPEYEAELEAIKEDYNNIKIIKTTCNYYKRDELEKLAAYNPDTILVMSDFNIEDEESDERTLLILLHLRDLATINNYKYRVTVEMRKVENQEVAQLTKVKDFVISDNITNLMVTQISQTRELNVIFDEFLKSEGSEIHMKLASDYVKLNVEVDMATCAYAASLKNEVFIGYKEITDDSFEIITSPNRDVKKTFKENEMFILLSEQ